MSDTHEDYYWQRVAEKVLGSYGNQPEDEASRDLGRRIAEASRQVHAEDTQQVLGNRGTWPVHPVAEWGC